jgi:hypothetical protein
MTRIIAGSERMTGKLENEQTDNLTGIHSPCSRKFAVSRQRATWHLENKFSLLL